MKVLIAATHLDKGGIAVYTVNLARHLKLAGIEAVVLSSGGELTSVLDREGIEHIETGIRTKAEFGPKVWRALPSVSRYVRQGSFDLIHSQTRVTQVMAEAIFRMTGTPYVTTCHGFFKHRRLSRRVFPCWGEKVIAISKSVGAHLVSDMRVSEEKVELVYNGIDLDLYGNVPEQVRGQVLNELGISENSTVVGTVGRFSSVKGFKYLVEAFGRLAEKRKDISLLLVGQGPEEAALVKMADDMAVRERIFFTSGKRPLEEYFSAIDIFCMPSLNEGFGLAVVEAMSSGKTCIVSAVGGLTEVVTDGVDGVVVSPADPKELAEAIERVSDDPDLRRRLSKGARKRAADFSLEKSAEGTIKVYRSVLEACQGNTGMKVAH